MRDIAIQQQKGMTMVRMWVLFWFGLSITLATTVLGQDGENHETALDAESETSVGLVTVDEDEASLPDELSQAEAERIHEDALASEESVARFERLLRTRPFHDAAFKGLVKTYTERGTLPVLVSAYEERVESLPDDFASRIVMARLYLRSGRAQEAGKIVDTLESLPEEYAKDRSKFLVFKAEVYQRTDRTEAALQMLQAALDEAKTISQRLKLTEALADLYIRSDDAEKAAEALAKLAAEYPDNYLHRKRIADAMSQRGLHQAAEKEYRVLLGLVAEEADRRCEVLRQLGRTLEALDRRQDAIDTYAEAINLLSPEHWLQQELNERIVTLHRASGRLDALVAYCREQIERTPNSIPMRVLLADVQAAMNDNDAAKETMATAVELFPKDLTLSERRVQLLERLGDVEGVSAEYERIISQQPDDLELYIAYGQFLAGNEQLEAARNQWKRVLHNDLADATLAVRLGALFEAYEMGDDAVECYERAINLAAERSDAYIALSRLWFYRGEGDKAKETLGRLAAAQPEDASVHAQCSQALLGLGMVDAAREAAERACELEPTSHRYQLARADLLVRAGRLEDALKVRRAALDLMSNPVEQSRDIGVLVSMYASASKLETLIECEKQHLEEKPDDRVGLLLLADGADMRRDFQASREWLQRLLEIEPNHEPAQLQYAKLYEAMGDVDQAVAVYQKLIDQHPGRSRSYYQAIVDAKLHYDDRAGAIETLGQMAQGNPDNATVLKEVAEQLVRLTECGKAITHFETCLRVQSDRYDVHLAYAKALKEDGQYEKALDAFRKAALQTRDRDVAAEALGLLHETSAELGKLDDLLEGLQLQVETDPDNTLIASTLAMLLVHEFEYARADQLLELVLRHHPHDVELLLVRAELLRRLTKFDEAFDVYRKLLRLPNADRDFVLGEMGKAYFESGRVDDAERVWRQINNRLYAGTLMRNNGLVTEAIDVFQEGIRLKPDDFALYRNLISALQLAGKTDDALTAARRLLDLEPDNILNIRALAETYLKRGDRKAAADVAARLFGAGATSKQPLAQSMSSAYAGGLPVWAMSLRSAWGGRGMGGDKLDEAIGFFVENGLMSELDEVLLQQMALQPDNAVLRQKAVALYADPLGKPEFALKLLGELETAPFPIEHQSWLGTSSQQDHFRIEQYQLIASKPALRDKRIAELEPKQAEEKLSRDEQLELAVIRQGQGVADEAISLLKKVVDADATDQVALSALVDALMRAERFEEAEPYAAKACEVLATEREAMQEAMVERVRRDFVRSLPVQFQLRMTDDLLRDIALKWTMGRSLLGSFTGSIQAMGYYRAQLSLATIYSKTDRMEKAREVWDTMRPTHPADADGWMLLAGIVQKSEQHDLAYTYYRKALEAAKILAGDPLLQRIYSGSVNQSWYGDEGGINTTFNRIVDAFHAHGELVELYDFLRETDQIAKARLVADQYDLREQLETLYRRRFDEAMETFKASTDDPLEKSIPLFMAACKLAELYDQNGDWPEAKKVFTTYLDAFPTEIGLLMTLGEIAEAQEEYAEAIEYEKRILDAKDALGCQAREWDTRQVFMTPDIPQILQGSGMDRWSWSQRWGKTGWWGYGSNTSSLAKWPSWMRLGQLYLALDNVVAAGDALERAVGAAGPDRDHVVRSVLNLIKERRLVGKMLSVTRSLAIQMPTDEWVQLAFAESLKANDRPEVAIDVYQRMLRRGVSNINTLAEVRRELAALQPDGIEEELVTLETLAAEVEADPQNANKLLRLARAQYYSLDLKSTLETLLKLQEIAPHSSDLHDLLIEVYTILGDDQAVISALRARIERTQDEGERNQARRRLADELLVAGNTEEALSVLKESVDPKDPGSYARVGLLLQYFGRYDEAVEQFELLGKSRRHGAWEDESADIPLAKVMMAKGDVKGAADRILAAVDGTTRDASYAGGLAGLFGYGNDASDCFGQFGTLFVLCPELQVEVGDRLLKRREENPADPLAAKVMMQFYAATGRQDLAEDILDELAGDGDTDQDLVRQLVDRAIQRQEYGHAIELAGEFIRQQPKPKLPPGMPAEYAGEHVLNSPRTIMLCTLGDLHWLMGDREKAFASYEQIVDTEVDESRIAYAAICLIRGRTDTAKTIVDDALSKQKVKSPGLLRFKTILLALEDDAEAVFDLVEKTIEASEVGGTSFAYGYDSVTEHDLARLAELTGRTERFESFMAERIQKKPNEWEPRSMLANTLMSWGQVEKAFDVLDEAEKVKSLRSEVMSSRLAWLRGFSTSEELIRLFETMIKAQERKLDDSANARQAWWGSSLSYRQSGNTGGMRASLGALLWNAGERDRAIEVWTKRRDPKNADTCLYMGSLYVEREEWRLAKQAYEKALALAPDSMDAHEALLTLCLRFGENEAALDHLRELFVKGRLTGRDSRRGESGGWDDPRRAVVIELTKDKELMEKLASNDDGVMLEKRLALAVCIGDWEQLSRDLPLACKATPYDPLLWNLLVQLYERKGDWAQAIRAHEFLRRLQCTTISRHRDQLKLVLAGRGIRDAAAGIRDDDSQKPAARGAASSRYRGYRGYGYYSRSSENRRLAELYLKLGDSATSERLYLASSGGERVDWMLPSLARLMWGQGAKERAVELQRLALVLEGHVEGLQVYANMLVDTDKADEAVALLIRAYRTTAGGSGNILESGDEANLSRSLYEILSRTGQRDAVLADLRQWVADTPEDRRLAKLLLSLDIHDGNWEEVGSLLKVCIEKCPFDKALREELLHAQMQLYRWDDALETIDALRAAFVEVHDPWRTQEAFCHLMKGDAAAALEVAKPLLVDDAEHDSSVSPGATCVLLATAEAYGPLRDYLEKHEDRRTLTASGRQLLCRVYLREKAYEKAAHLALEALWKDSLPLARNRVWFRHLVRSLRLTDTMPKGREGHPEDDAVIRLVTDGPDAARTAFRRILEEDSDHVNAHRGLVFAEDLAGDWAAAAKVNARFLDTLESRRRQVWWKGKPRTLRAMVKEDLCGKRDRPFAISELMQESGYSGDSIVTSLSLDFVERHTFDELWREYTLYQNQLLFCAGDVDSVITRLQAQGRYAEITGGERADYRGRRIEPRADSTYVGSDGLCLGWRHALWWGLGSRLMWSSVVEHLNDKNAPPYMWGVLYWANAGEGAFDAARDWRDRIVAVCEMAAKVQDQPDISPDGGWSSWRWSYYRRDWNSHVETIRSELDDVFLWEEDARRRSGSLTGGLPRELWEYVLTQPGHENVIEDAERVVGPGWEDTIAFRTLVQYYDKAREYAKLRRVLERVFEGESLLTSSYLSEYVQACLMLGDDARVSTLLDELEDYSAATEDSVRMLRLVLLRRQGKNEEADTLEAELIAACREPQDSPVRIADGLRFEPTEEKSRRVRPLRNYLEWWDDDDSDEWEWSSLWNPWTDKLTIADVADALDVRFDDPQRNNVLTLNSLAECYWRLNMFEHAARLHQRALDVHGDNLAPLDRLPYETDLFHNLEQADHDEEAKAACERAIAGIQSTIREYPESAVAHWQLAGIYERGAFGRDYEQALAAVRAAKRLDPGLDAADVREASLLFELERYPEAWTLYKKGIRRDGEKISDVSQLYQIGLAATRAGDVEEGVRLLRVAIWSDPKHPKAAEAQKVIDEAQANKVAQDG